MSMPLITIGITCHSEGDWLLECWESVLAQTDDRWVAVLVMDGTEDNRTREIFEHLEHPKLLKYALPKNMGPYPTRNKAFELTETPFHFYLDGDDQLFPQSVALVLRTFTEHPEAAFVYGDYECFGSHEEVWRFPWESADDDLVERQATPGPCAYKRQVWEHLGGFTDELAWGNGDYDFLIGAAEAGLKGYHCGDLFYRYRLGHTSKVSSSYGRRYHQTHEIIIRRHPKFFKEKQRRGRFLALGYKQSAYSNYVAGEVNQAWKFTKAAIRHGMWSDQQLWSLILRIALPRWGFNALRSTWRSRLNIWRQLRKGKVST